LEFTYSQSSGAFTLQGEYLGTGYSGRGAGLNNGALQNVPDVGPIPRGVYTFAAIDPPDHLGPVAFRLIPDAANAMFGRYGFCLHADNAQQNHTASCGCIILMPVLRQLVDALVRAAGSRLRLWVVQ